MAKLIDKYALLNRLTQQNMFGQNQNCPEWVFKIIRDMPEQKPVDIEMDYWEGDDRK